MAPVRTMLLWCPDWPVIAADIVDGVSATTPVAVLHANRVVACSASARAEGVRRGLRKREAQSRCPRLTVLDHDPGRDVRAFEPVVAAVEEVVAGVEVIRPGACAVAARGPTRYFGGEEQAAERIVEHVAETCEVESQLGIADGVFAAGLAARSGRIVPSGGTPEFLAGLPVEALGRPSLTDLLRRLGLRTLGDFAALPAGDVLARFGFDGTLAHRLAGGGDHRPLAVRRPPPDLAVAETYEDPLDRVDAAAFAARTLAERLHDTLAGHALACTRLAIEAVTADGQELRRVWRHDGLLTTTAIADRLRWQLDGWLTGTSRRPGSGRVGPARPTAGITRLRLVPEGVLAHVGLQPGLWGETGAERERAHRVLSRVQGILGPESVVTAVLGGGRIPADQARLVPWGDERTPGRPVAPPWPGRLPSPAPAVVLPALLPAAVFDAAGELVRVTARLEVSAPPARLELAVPSPQPAPGGAAARSAGAASGQLAGAVPGGLLGAVPGGLAVGLARDVSGGLSGAVSGRSAGVVSGRLAAEMAPGGAVGRSSAAGARSAGSSVGATAGSVEIIGWAGPWPVDERWWAPAEARRRARFQVCLADGTALLLSLTGGRWWVEAVYD